MLRGGALRTCTYALLALLAALSLNVALTSSYQAVVCAYASSILEGKRTLDPAILEVAGIALVDVIPVGGGYVAAHSAGFVLWAALSSHIIRLLRYEDASPFHCSVALNALAAALGLLTLFYLEKVAKMYLSDDLAPLIAVIYALGSIAWPYSITAYSQSFAAPFVALGLYHSIVYHRIGRLRDLVVAAAALSLAALSDHVLALSLAPLLLEAVLRGKLRDITAVALACSPFAASAAFYYRWAIGSPWPTQARYASMISTKPFDVSRIVRELSLFELIAGARKSLLVTCLPLAVLSLWGVASLSRANKAERREVLVSLTLFAVCTLMYASWYDWHGGLSYGPRLLCSLLPMLVPALCVGLRSSTSALRAGIITTLAISAVNSIVVSTNPFSCPYQEFSGAPLPQAFACSHNAPGLSKGCLSPTLLGALGLDCLTTAATLFTLSATVIVLWALRLSRTSFYEAPVNCQPG